YARLNRCRAARDHRVECQSADSAVQTDGRDLAVIDGLERTGRADPLQVRQRVQVQPRSKERRVHGAVARLQRQSRLYHFSSYLSNRRTAASLSGIVTRTVSPVT